MENKLFELPYQPYSRTKEKYCFYCAYTDSSCVLWMNDYVCQECRQICKCAFLKPNNFLIDHDPYFDNLENPVLDG